MTNFSSSTPESAHHHSSSTNNSTFSIVDCFFISPSSIIFGMFFITYILLLLPLCVLIFYCGLHDYWRKSSTSSAATISHSDSFTYHLVIVELIGVFGCILSLYGIYKENLQMLSLTSLPLFFSCHGETVFHVLMCGERYLAVVHPITYRSLRNERGIRIRNISICGSWLSSFIWTGLVKKPSLYVVLNFCISITFLAFVSLCSLFVLCVLTRPGPGEQGGGSGRVHQSKQRAFCIIVAILGVLVLKSIWGLVQTITYLFEVGDNCIALAYGFFCFLPSSLVSPLLFLHRVKRSICCK